MSMKNKLLSEEGTISKMETFKIHEEEIIDAKD